MKRLVFCALVGASMLVLAAPAAAEPNAELESGPKTTQVSQRTVTLTPSNVRAGGQVTVFANCGHGENYFSEVKSSAFATTSMSGTTGGRQAIVTVPKSTRAGSYKVTVTCGEGGQRDVSTATLVVTGAQTATVPKGGVATGAGGAAAGAGLSGWLVVVIVAGLAALGAGFLLRRRAKHA